MIRTQSARNVSAAGGQAAAVVAAPHESRRHTVHKVSGSYSGAGTAGTLEIRSGGTVIWSVDVPAGGRVSEDFNVAPLRCKAGEALEARLTGAGTTILATVNLQYAGE